MSIKLPSALTVSGIVVDTAAAPVVGFKLRAKLLAPDGRGIATVVSGANPVEVSTGADGSFSLGIKDATAIKLLLTQGYSVLFKSGADDTPDALDIGLSRSTPLHLNAHQAVSVVLEWQPTQAGDANKPAVAAQLHVRAVARDKQTQEQPLLLKGQVLGLQSMPIAGLELTAGLVVPFTGQTVEFPQPDNRPSGDTSAEDGSFQIRLERAGDLIPFQPYSMYGIRFSARQIGSLDHAPGGVATTSTLLHINPAENTLIKLSWDVTDPTKPQLAITLVRRDQVVGKPNEGILEALGQLVDNASGKPLFNHRVQIQAGAASTPMGEMRTDAHGYFSLPHPWPLAWAVRDVSMQWKLQVSDPEGKVIASNVALSQDGLTDSALVVRVAVPAQIDTSPTVAQLLGALAKTMDPKTQTALDSAQVKSLQDLLNIGSLQAIKGTVGADDATLAALERAADLWSLLPDTVTAADAATYIAAWLSKGIAGTLDLGNMPRARGTAALKDQLGELAAAKTHSIAAARNNLFNFLLLGERTDAARQSSQGRARHNASSSNVGPNAARFSEDTESGCSCEDCQTAVSPNAYLMDLIRYVYLRVSNSSTPVAVADLQTLFFQPFADLPSNCDSTQKPVLTTRIAIEILYAYKATLTLGTTLATTLATAQAAYRQQAYDAILSELGTTETELRLAVDHSDVLDALATRLSLPSQTQVLLLLLSSADLADETILESRFGLRASTRAALDAAQPDPPSLLTWRLQSLKSAWLTQDTPTLFHSGVPILDPDVLDFPNLRQGWDSTAASTIMWNARRTAVDAQLTASAQSRAMAVGSATMAITQPTVTTPSSDQKWAAYLSVTLNDDEIQSKAAVLPLDQQDQAKLLAAQQKAQTARTGRGAMPDALTSDELATIAAVVNYVGTGLTTAVQNAAKTWIEAQFTNLVPATGSAIPSFADWTTMQTVLKGTAAVGAPSIDTVNSNLTRFYFTTDAFLRAYDLRLKLVNQGALSVTPDEWNEFDAIFVALWKASQVTSWLAAEALIPIQVTTALFWVSPDQPAQRKWLGSADRYQQWLTALQSAISAPIINPALIRPSAFLNTTTTDPIFSLWIARETWLEAALLAIQTARSLVDAAMTGKLAVFDDKVLATSLLVPKLSTTAHLWYEPDQLQAAYDNGTMTGTRLSQLLLDRNGFQAIFALRSLYRDGKTPTDQEWTPASMALLKAEIQQQYGTWHGQETTAALSLSPDYFQLPAQLPLTFPPQESPDQDPTVPALFTRSDLQQWRSILSDRIAQEASVRQDQADTIDRVEQAVLGSLRDSLVAICGEGGGFPVSSYVEALTDRFLFDFADSTTNKTTRIAQAIATLQLLLFNLRNGDLFRLSTPESATLYPTLSLAADLFDTEWQWLGSYGSWRSALFIFMYPENLLNPTLRNPAEQSQPFKDVVDALRANGPVTPDAALALGRQYNRYFGDLSGLYVQASCTVTIPVTSGTTTSGTTQDLCLLFGIAGISGMQAYFSVRTTEASIYAKQSLWNPLPGWAMIQQIYGAVPWYSKSGKHLVSIFAMVITSDGTQKLQVLNLDLSLLDQGPAAFGSGPKDLSDLPYTSASFPNSIVVEQVSPVDPYGTPIARVPRVYVASYLTSGGTTIEMYVYRRPLNDDGTGWAGSDWPSYQVDQIHQGNALLAGFTLNNYSAPDDPKTGYQFIAQKAGYGTPILYNSNYVATSGSPGADLSSTLGYFTGVAVFGLPGDYNIYALLTGTNYNRLTWGAYGSTYFETMSNVGYARRPLPQSVETLSHVSGNVVTIPIVDIGWYSYIVDATGQFATLDIDFYYLTVAENLFNHLRPRLQAGASVGAPLAAGESSADLKNQCGNDWYNNEDAPSMLVQVYEAYFALPIHIATQLQQAGFYQEALDWYRTVFDHTIHNDIATTSYGLDSKVYYGLVAEETEPDDGYVRMQQWIDSPFDPHAIAAMRENSYTRFTMINVVRCLLEYADSLFATDTAETVPEARTLYQEALQWLASVELRAPLDCPAVVAEMDFSFVPNDWLGSTGELRASLVRALGELSRSASSQLQSSVLAALKDPTTPKWGDRFANAAAAIRAALAAVPPAPKVSAMLTADRKARQAAHLKLLATPVWQRADKMLRQYVSRRFKDATAKLTGVAPDTSTGDSSQTNVWLGKPGRSRGVSFDPTNRSPMPMLSQPATAVSRAVQQRWRSNSLTRSQAGVASPQLLAAPTQAPSYLDLESLRFVPTSSVQFCIPPNPVINGLLLQGQLNLYKLRSGRNISGVQRQLDFYAAPTDAQTGLPSVTGNGGLSLNSGTRSGPTEFRYAVLIDRARRQVQVAAQFESQLLQALEQADNQQENLLRARNELATQQATLNLKNLEIQEAQYGVNLITVQQQKNAEQQDYLQGLINQDLSGLEQAALGALGVTVVLQTVAAYTNGIASLLYLAANANPFEAGEGGAQAVGSVATALNGFASVSSTMSQIFSMQASFERRKADWQQQLTQSGFDAQVLNIQAQQSALTVQIKQQDSNITSLQIQQAQSVVDFLVTKFTNAELFEWMSRILQGLYASQLQQATATARQAQQQLAFDLLQNIDTIGSDYWTVPVDNSAPSGALAAGATSTTDRKGLTGAERLQADIEQLDGFAAQQTTRKMQLSRTISLATTYPGDFQRLKETGEMWFATAEQDFDMEFPGHYFRRIRQVKISVLALVPPVRGIRATLTNIGSSQVTIPGTAGFTTQVLPPSNDSVSYTAPQNASGLFEMDVQPDLLLPFEGVGVDTLWHFELPMPANPMDFASIADVQVSFGYTALYSADYRAQLLADPVRLPRTFSGVRVFSFRSELVDQWYALHNPPLAPTDLRATFSVDATDFPSGMSNVRVRRLTLYMPIAPDASGATVDLSKDNVSKQIGLALGNDAAPALQALDSDSLIVAQSAADPWFRQLPAKTQSPVGTWTVVLPATQAILDLLRADQIQDILFAISYEADLPDWPSGLRPKRSLF